jgi:hypothetical protein
MYTSSYVRVAARYAVPPATRQALNALATMSESNVLNSVLAGVKDQPPAPLAPASAPASLSAAPALAPTTPNKPPPASRSAPATLGSLGRPVLIPAPAGGTRPKPKARRGRKDGCTFALDREKRFVVRRQFGLLGPLGPLEDPHIPTWPPNIGLLARAPLQFSPDPLTHHELARMAPRSHRRLAAAA